MYQYNMESKQAYHIDRLINEIATRRIKEAIKLEHKPKVNVKTRTKK
jgi:hypothetical protein